MEFSPPPHPASSLSSQNQLFEQIRDLILSGVLRGGKPLPPSRPLAQRSASRATPSRLPKTGRQRRVALANVAPPGFSLSRFFLAQARIVHCGDRAFYRPSTDHIQMPDEDRFCGTDTMTRSEGYYATLAHECLHWSGSEKRLNREFGKRFGDARYAAEELVAEIGSGLLCAELRITQVVRADHAQYLAQWPKLLKDDSRAIFTAAAKVSEAVAYLKKLLPPG